MGRAVKQRDGFPPLLRSKCKHQLPRMVTLLELLTGMDMPPIRCILLGI